MTAGHKHRTIHVKRDGLLLRALQVPLLKTTDRERAYNSRWVWGLRQRGGPNECYAITPLGILHTLFGLTVMWDDDE